jgi:uridine monophosphate synthetase
MIYPRKEVKTYGTKAEIEGEYHAGETVVVIDDLANTGSVGAIRIDRCGPAVQDVVAGGPQSGKGVA